MKNEKTEMERMYIEVGLLAHRLIKAGKRMNCDELLNWINENFTFNHNYGGVRGVLQAAHRRTDNPDIKKALEEAFVDMNGEPLSWSF